MPSNNGRRPRPAKQGATKKTGAERSAPAPIIAHQRLLNTKGAASYLGISARTLWTLTNMGQLPAVRFGTGGRRSVRFDVNDLDAFIERQRTGGQA